MDEGILILFFVLFEIALFFVLLVLLWKALKPLKKNKRIGITIAYVVLYSLLFYVLTFPQTMWIEQDVTEATEMQPTQSVPTQTVPTTVPITQEEKQAIDTWIEDNNLNTYGDPKDTAYAGGTPLFNESTGEYIDKYDYIKAKHPDTPWNN